MQKVASTSSKAEHLRILGEKLKDKGACLKGFKTLVEAAKLGDEEAQVSVGYDLAYGITGKANVDEAFRWWKRAYRQGSWAAAFNFGMFYRDEKEWSKALKWFERAVEAGDEDGLIEIAKIHLRYAGDRAAGLRYLKRAAAAKNDLTEQARVETERLVKEQAALSAGDLLYMEADLLDERRQYAKAYKLLLKGAKADDASCQTRLAGYLSNGRRGVPADREKAIYWYKEAYRRGHAIAAFNLAITYRSDDDVDEAYRWFELGVEAGDREAHLRLARIWLYDRSDKVKAIEHLKLMFAGNTHDLSEGGRDEARTMLRRLQMERK